MLYSAAGVTLPSQQGAPPITTQRPIRSASFGSRLSASAMLVRGPSVTRVRPGSACARRRIASTAGSSSGLRFGVGNPRSPRPSLPWNQCAWSCARLRGLSAPANTGTSERQISAVKSAFWVACSRPTLPATVVRPRTLTLRIGQRHHDRDGVVGGGVGVDEKVAHGVHISCVRRVIWITASGGKMCLRKSGVNMTRSRT